MIGIIKGIVAIIIVMGTIINAMIRMIIAVGIITGTILLAIIGVWGFKHAGLCHECLGGLREAVLGFRVCFLGLGLGFRVLVVRFWVLRFLA